MIFRLAIKDIHHDWLLSICLVISIASIISPLLILFGLKFGTIQTMRGRLIEDPKNREIRPMSTKSYNMEFFEKLKSGTPEAAFVVPMTRQISTSITVVNPTRETREQISLMATAEGDPLILENGATVPLVGYCVLTETAAKSLQVSVGDELVFSTRRILNDKSENGEFIVRVSGVVEARAGSFKTAFVPLEVVEAVEDFKDGRAVPAYGWAGKLPTAYSVYEGAGVFVSSPIGKLDEVMLTNNTGFTQLKKIGTEQMIETFGFVPSREWLVYLLTAKKHETTEESIQSVRNKLRGKEAIILPWINPLDITLTSPAHPQPVTLKLYIASEEIENAIASRRISMESELKDESQSIYIPADIPFEEGEATLMLTVEDRRISLPITLIKKVDIIGNAFASNSFASKLNLLRYRNLKYDDQNRQLLLFRGGYAGFRLYAKSIDEVGTLQRKLEDQGILVSTEQERIEEVRRLDKYLGLIFWLIAAVGMAGGISALTASLYASVERKKRELNVLRLLGMLKRELVLFPVLQGLLLSGSSSGLSGFIFLIVAEVINHLFRGHLRESESLCTLSFSHFMFMVVGVSFFTICSAAIAAIQATQLDPAEAIRND